MYQGALRLYSAFDLSAPGANTSFPAGGVSLRSGCTAIRVGIALTTSSIVNLVGSDGTTTHVWGLNKSVALGAADAYTFTQPVPQGLTYYLQIETDGVVEMVVLDAIAEG